MPRYAPRVDKNQKEIVEALRAAGIQVLHAHALGKNAPDLICAWGGKNVLLEIKAPAKRNMGSRGGKSPEPERIRAQKAWCEEWNGPACVVHTFEEALMFVTVGLRPEILAEADRKAIA